MPNRRSVKKIFIEKINGLKKHLNELLQETKSKKTQN